MTKQASITSFFKKGPTTKANENIKITKDKDKSDDGSSQTVAHSTISSTTHQDDFDYKLYPLETTVVKKRTRETAENSNTMTFYTGTLKSYSTEKRTYQVHLQNDVTKRTKTEIWTAKNVEWGVFLHRTLGTKVAKEFGGVIYEGSIVDLSKWDGSGEIIYRVFYHQDGDSEDFTTNELEMGKALYQREFGDLTASRECRLISKSNQYGNRSTNGSPESKSGKKKRTFKSDEETNEDKDEDKNPIKNHMHQPDEASLSGRLKELRRSTKKNHISYKELEDDEDEFVDDKFLKRGSKGSKKYKKNTTSIVTKVSSIVEADSDFEMISVDGEDDIDHELESDLDLNDGIVYPSKKKSKRANSKVKKSDSNIYNNYVCDISQKNSDVQAELDALVKKKMVWNVPNNPQKLPAAPYVEPLGIDPTDGIVEGLIGSMVRKVGKLLQSTIKVQNHDRDIGEIPFPIKLQTACSGTDAPSISLGLIQEACSKLESEKVQCGPIHEFQYSHEMSCEIEPFKQAYIGRNFPGVLLFPDITKLTESKTVIDVYGRAQTIPKGNLFIAGTSCKDFSMLKSTNRKDIEDKGTSGETFLAAVEFLEQEKPNVAIFENVYNAPWGKMQEYITGRVKLVNRNDHRSIIGKNGKNTLAEKDLLFSVGNDRRYVVESVPQQVGIRAGSIVEGFVKGASEKNIITQLLGDTQTSNYTVTLEQLAKKHKIDLDKDTLILEKHTKYCTRLLENCDTKLYGLPQTRQRKYLFIWKSDDPNDDLGDYFEEIMEYLKTPLQFSMEAFLLPDTHDRIRCFREALLSGPGLMVARDRAKQLDFWDWESSRIKDLASHIAVRKLLGLAEKSRWITNWDQRSTKVAPPLWPELCAMWNYRRCDLIDIFAAAAARDAIPRDPLHHAFSWDLSQNVDRTPYRSSTVGVSGCVTPGGELLLTHRGRTMMGYEKLLLQGIPFSRLLLGPETEVQLSDLAGNAMSLTVVSAAILAAICAPQLRRERNVNKGIKLQDFEISHKYDSSKGEVISERGDLYGVTRDYSSQEFTNLFTKIAKEMADDAYMSSVLCTCETSGRTSRDHKILVCRDCGFGICHSCSDRTQIFSHQLKEISRPVTFNRPDPHSFEVKLRRLVPSTLKMKDGWEQTLSECHGLESYSFQLQQVSRRKGHWALIYGAWEDFGSGRQVAEIRVYLGRIGILDPPHLGFSAFVKCYGAAIRLKNPKRGPIKDCARLVMQFDANREAKTKVGWEIRAPDTKQTLTIIGTDPTPSLRVEIGLSDKSAQSLRDHKVQSSFIPNIKSRNDLLHYHSKWKTWPGKLEVTGDCTGLVNGTYLRLSCRHTTVLSALWRREIKDDHPALYIYFRPDVIRTGLDIAVIARTPCYRDDTEVCELSDWIPENGFIEKTYNTSATFLNWKRCDHLLMGILPPTLTMEPNISSFHEILTKCHDNDNFFPVLVELNGLSTGVIASLLQHCNNHETQSAVHLDLLGKSGTQNAKRLSILSSPYLLKFAAECKLPLKLSHWYCLQASRHGTFGYCERYFPSRPVEIWKELPGKKDATFVRYYDAQASNEYYTKLLQRPTAFNVIVDKESGKLIIRMNPFVAAHQAAAYLTRGRGLDENYSNNLVIQYCLSELSSMGEPATEEFRVPSSDCYEEADAQKLKELGLVLPLYPRQAKALTRMQSIENGEVHFIEEERSEHVLNGVGWTLIARASKKVALKGGVLGDAIGSGKTVVTIALILSGIEKARRNRDVANGRSSATLIVVPPGLVKQWDDERKKFTKNKLSCTIIDSTKSLMNCSVNDICNADIVIVPAGLIEEKLKSTDRPYTENLSKMAGSSKIPPAPSSYSQKEAPSIEGTWIRNMGSGPVIYVGNNGKQRTRDEQAYYGYRYAEAIKQLRLRKFGESEKGIPLEYFTWERVIIDECHESLVTAHGRETTADDFKQQARRGAREFLGVSHLDARSRPLVASTAIWGLTGTPLLETEARVTELANLMGGTYLTGSAHHWRREERDSGRDLFLNQQEGSKSREYRCAVQNSCLSYVRVACQRNRGNPLDIKVERKSKIVNMMKPEGDDFISAIKQFNLSSFTINPDQLGDRASHALTISSTSVARHSALVEILEAIHAEDPDTKIIVFANSFYGGYQSAKTALELSRFEFCHVGDNVSVIEQNEIISYFRHTDATLEDRSRPRILLLSFEQAAGHNLQEACHNVIMFDPMYSGSDAVADASQEEQALGRVLRQGQKYDVNLTRIVLRGSSGEHCFDDWIVSRNEDEDILRAATSNFD